MAPSAGKDDKKTARRKLIQPVLPIFPQKPKSQPQPPGQPLQPLELCQNENFFAATPEKEQSPEGVRRDYLAASLSLQDEDKENSPSEMVPSETSSSINGSKYEDGESSTTRSSSNTQKAFSLLEPSSTPASEVTTPPTDETKEEDAQIPVVDLSEAETVVGNPTISFEVPVLVAADSASQVSPPSTRSRSVCDIPPVSTSIILDSTITQHSSPENKSIAAGLEVISNGLLLAEDTASATWIVEEDVAPQVVEFETAAPCSDDHGTYSTEPDAEVGEFPNLTQYLQRSLVCQQDYDCTISVSLSGSTQHHEIYAAHSFILCRCLVLRNFLLHARLSQQPGYVVHINWITPLDIQRGAFEAILKFLYTDIPLQMQDVGPLFLPASHFDPHTETGRAKNVISLIISHGVAALQLDLALLVTHSTDLLSGIVGWENLEVIVKTALGVQTHGELLMAHVPVNDHRSRRNRIVRFSGKLLKLVVAFMSRRWLRDLTQFSLDISQPQSLPTYLPQTPELTSSLRNANAVLSRLQFGSMPVTDSASAELTEQPFTLPNRVTSAILVNLPFEELVEFFEQIKSDLQTSTGSLGNLYEIFAAVIQERERRRRIVLQSTQVNLAQRSLRQAEWDVVGFHEYLQNVDGDMYLKRDSPTGISSLPYHEA